MKTKLHTCLAAGAIATLLTGCSSDDGAQSIDDSSAADRAFEGGPMYLTGAFDGSKAFRMWQRTTHFTREFERTYGKPLKFSYFINSAYFDHTVTGSWIGTSLSARESLVRFAITQQAINEGHEIGNHTVRHRDGSEWTEDQWRAELTEFRDLTEANLFKPIFDDEGTPVFPRWRAMPDAAPGETGASCTRSSECTSGSCIEVALGQSFCTAGCNKNNPCANGTVCGGSNWNESLDVCYPVPEFPVVHNGEVLFDDNGVPNLDALESYPMIGFRAPQLGHNEAMYEVLSEFGYRYDTSKILRPGAPGRVSSGRQGRTFPDIYEFALMKYAGSRTIPMDYNYKVNDGSGERMLLDYQTSVRAAYANGRKPWNIGHHFSLWRGGAYWQAMMDTFNYAAEGCPDSEGTLHCENVEFPTFVDLADSLDAITAGRSSETGDTSDVFSTPGIDADSHTYGEAGCAEHDAL